MVDLRVCVDCPGCATKIKKALEKLDGVDKVEVEMEKQRVRVTGWVSQDTVLKRVRRMGKRAEPWTPPYNPKLHCFDHFYKQHKTFLRTANPEETYSLWSGKKVREFEYDPLPASNGDVSHVASIFSDDNPANCSVM